MFLNQKDFLATQSITHMHKILWKDTMNKFVLLRLSVVFYNQYTNSGGACNASYDTPLRVEALPTCQALIAGTVHSHKVMRSSWVKWCWKWIISSLSPNGTVGTFLLDLVLRGHPSSTTAQGSGFTHHRHRTSTLPPQPKHLTWNPYLIQSYPYGSTPATAFL